jgi:type III pantothenate kinase
MIPQVVADIGNSRIKWGRCLSGVVADVASLPADDPLAWDEQCVRWQLPQPICWSIAGVHPDRLGQFGKWVRQRGDAPSVLDNWQQLPLQVTIERPEQVGLDRLFNAVAGNSRRQAGVPAVIADAGTAVTVDWLDEHGAFAGGSIFPGLGLMAQALHEHTALLPLVAVHQQPASMPGRSTVEAIQAGVFAAAGGGIRELVRRLTAGHDVPFQFFLTGGDATLLAGACGFQAIVWPTMTLEGIRLTAEAMP